jgi:hypothetical protein
VERGLAVLAVDLERLAKVALGFLRLGRVAHVVLGRRDVEAGREAAVRRRARFLEELVGELLPVLRGEIELLDPFLRHRVVGLDREHGLERGARTVDVEQFAVEDHPLLEQQVDLAAVLRRRGELEIEQARHAIGSPARREHLARGGELRRANVWGCLTSDLR